MKRIIILVFLIIISSIFLKSTLTEKVTMNYDLVLGKKFFVSNVFISDFGYETEIVLKGGCYKVNYKDSFIDVCEYGYVEKLSKYRELWIGYIPPYQLGTSDKGYFEEYNERKETLDDFNKKIKKFKGYFIINKDIEKIGMSEEELVKYLKIKGIEEINFQDPNYYVQRYGSFTDLTPYYVNKNVNYGVENKKEKTIDQFKAERVVRIIACIIFIFLGIVGIIYVSINKIRIIKQKKIKS